MQWAGELPAYQRCVSGGQQYRADAGIVKSEIVYGTNNNTFDPNFVDKQDRTNVQRMQQGLAHIGTDGKSVNIHHIDQTNNGSVMEITATEHQ